jgi:hypothetical protein
VHVETQDLAEQDVGILSVVRRIVARTAVAERGIEKSVGSKTEPPRLVTAGSGRLRDRDDRRGADGSAMLGFDDT